MLFYLGTHHPHWLDRCDVPLFVSHRRLAERKSLPRAITRWALDSGGFTELSMFGEWRTRTDDYVAAVRRYADEIGSLDFAAPQDWMCEPWIVEKTGLSVGEHQRRTTENYLRLRDEASDLPFMPVLQGWTLGDYMRHVDDYTAAGVDLAALPRVGIGSVCRRGQDADTETFVKAVSAAGVQLHGFGVKTTGLMIFGEQLASADSLAWSFNARRSPPLPGCTHKACANCSKYALLWRERLLSRYEHRQMRLAI